MVQRHTGGDELASTGSQSTDVAPVAVRASLYPRTIAAVVREALGDTPVVCVTGPRQSGKTTLVQNLVPDRAYFSMDDHNLARTADSDPVGFVQNLPPMVAIDEVQRAPTLFPAIKLAVDKDRRPGRFLLTGSSNLLFSSAISESLAGRMEVVNLQPFTEAEKERQPGNFLKTLVGAAFDRQIRESAAIEGPSLAERLVAGGFPNR